VGSTGGLGVYPRRISDGLALIDRNMRVSVIRRAMQDQTYGRGACSDL